MVRSTLILLIFILGCQPRVIHFINDNAPYSGFEFYQITNVKINNADLSDTGQQIIKSIESSIRSEMERRNYQARKNPDLIVRYELISNQETDVNVNNFGFYGPFNPYRTINVRTFLESALLIEIINLKSNKVIWHASVDMNNYRKEKNMDGIIQKAVVSIYNTYPYRAGSRARDESLIIE